MRHLVYVLRRRPELTREAFQRYWREVHGPLVASYAELLGIVRYVQVHTLDNPLRQSDVRGELGTAYDGVAELWVDPERATGTEEQRQAAGRVLAEDEVNFIDFPNSAMWHGVDRTFVDAHA
jgi:uncharacterized protein (TIGR02118 family)